MLSGFWGMATDHPSEQCEKCLRSLAPLHMIFLATFRWRGWIFHVSRALVGFPVNFLLCPPALSWWVLVSMLVFKACKQVHEQQLDQPENSWRTFFSLNTLWCSWVLSVPWCTGPTLSFRWHAHSAIVVPNWLISVPPGTFLDLTTQGGGTPGQGCCDPPCRAQDSPSEDYVVQHATVAEVQEPWSKWWRIHS